MAQWHRQKKTWKIKRHRQIMVNQILVNGTLNRETWKMIWHSEKNGESMGKSNLGR
jgi:hypothetical protein